MKPEQIMALDKKYKKIKEQSDECQGQLVELKRTNLNLTTSLEEMEEEKTLLGNSPNSSSDGRKTLNEVPKIGVYFSVQLGAYKEYKTNNFNDGDLATEIDTNLKKYTIGTYATLHRAEEVRNDFVSMGVEDAWVVGYNNGTRISKEEADKLTQ